MDRAVAVLEEKCHITNYDVPQAGVIRIFEGLDRSWAVNRELIRQDIKVKESYLAGQDLEGYFMDLLGNGQAPQGETPKNRRRPFTLGGKHA